jgi:integrase/recombinase XerD
MRAMANPSLYTRRKNGERWTYERIKEGRGHRNNDLSGPFYSRPVVNGRQLWKTLSAETYAEAREEASHLTYALQAQAKGFRISELESVSDADRIPLKQAVNRFISNAESTKKKKTVLGYRLNLSQFVQSAKSIRFLDEITKDTLYSFRDFLGKRGYEARTQHNRVVTVISLLNENKIETGFSLRKDLPRFQEEIASAYTDNELKMLFGEMDAEETVRYKFFLGTGCRDKEVTYAAWTDINFEKKTYHVQQKGDVGFSPKSHEDRIIPLPTVLVDMLKSRGKNKLENRWLFVNEDGRPDNHFLRKLKRIAFRAGLNCGACVTNVTKGRYDSKHRVQVSCKTDPVCSHIYLHRFRKTCATRWHKAGVPIRTIQRWLGHKSLETTQIYLGETDASKLRSEIDRAFGD